MPTTAKQLLEAANAAVPKISGKEAQEMVAKGALLVDIRDSAELAPTGKAAGAVHIPRGSLEFKADPDVADPDKNFARTSRDPALRLRRARGACRQAAQGLWATRRSTTSAASRTGSRPAARSTSRGDVGASWLKTAVSPRPDAAPACTLRDRAPHTQREASSALGTRPSGVNSSIAPGNSRRSPDSSSSRDMPVCWRQRVDVVAADRLRQVAFRNVLVRPAADPGVGGLALAVLLELVEQAAEAAAQHAAGRAAGQQAAEPARAVRPARRRRAGRRAAAPPAAAENAAQPAAQSAGCPSRLSPGMRCRRRRLAAWLPPRCLMPL